MKISKNIDDNYILMTIEGSLSVENLRHFEQEMHEALDKNLDLIIDLSEVVFIDSSSLGVIVVFFTKLNNINRHLVLLNVNKDIYEMFSITGLAKRVKICNSLDDALDHIKKQ